MIINTHFYLRDPQNVARDMLGKIFVCHGKELIISETEAYLGPEDLASHARFGPTARTKIMWDEGGHLYVYLIYGMYEMANITTGPAGHPGAVLLRAGLVAETGEKIAGPGKLSRYLGLSRKDTGRNLQGLTLKVEDRGIVPMKIVASPRIGIDYAGPWAKKKLRFVALF